MRALRQCRSEDIFTGSIDISKHTASYSKGDMYFLNPPEDEYSDPSIFESDSEEDSFEFEPIPFRPFTEIESRGDPRDASVYIDAMAQILRDEETHHLIAHGSIEFLHGSRIRQLRLLLGEWLCSLSFVYPSTTETLFQAASLLDRYLSKRFVPFSRLQLMACCCLWVSAKVELHSEESLDPLISYCHNKYTRADFIKAEGEILGAVDYEIHAVTAHFFLKRFMGAVAGDERVALVAAFLCESTLLFIELSSFRPSLKAFCVVAAASLACGVSECGENFVNFMSGWDREEIVRCFSMILRAGQSARMREQHIPFQKYAARPIGGVSGGGAALLKSVDLEDDLIRRMSALLGQQ
jgi:hypothetical protein